jgi:hypothetical protein
MTEPERVSREQVEEAMRVCFAAAQRGHLGESGKAIPSLIRRLVVEMEEDRRGFAIEALAKIDATEADDVTDPYYDLYHWLRAVAEGRA